MSDFDFAATIGGALVLVGIVGAVGVLYVLGCLAYDFLHADRLDEHGRPQR